MVRESIRVLAFLPSNVAMKTFGRELFVGPVQLSLFGIGNLVEVSSHLMASFSFNGCIPESAEIPQVLNLLAKAQTISLERCDSREPSAIPSLISDSFVHAAPPSRNPIRHP